MNPILGTLLTMIGMWASWNVGYHINDWVGQLFSYRARVTETHLVIEKAAPVQIHYDGKPLKGVDQKREEKVLDLLDDGWEDKLLCDLDHLEKTDTLDQVIKKMSGEQRDALYYLIEQAIDHFGKQGQVEETVELMTYGGNVRYLNMVTPKQPPVPYYDHLDL